MPLRCTRRSLLLAPLAAVSGCAALASGSETIIEAASRRRITRDQLLATLRASDVVLLGEQHDNPLHHIHRAELIAALPVSTVVVAEHLTRGQRVSFGTDLLASLRAAGFEAQGWRWPLHAPLFAAVQRAGMSLQGGNLPLASARRIVREGEAALDAELAALLLRAPLDAQAQATLDDALVQGHCGQLRSPGLERMRWAQRARDAAMALALDAAGGRPALLLAGNGHVRTDHGVPRLLRALRPVVRLAAVGFIDSEPEPGSPYTHLWRTAPPPSREDPCAGFSLPPAPTSAG
jgi:uncharacterized iron-regulated protein